MQKAALNLGGGIYTVKAKPGEAKGWPGYKALQCDFGVHQCTELLYTHFRLCLGIFCFRETNSVPLSISVQRQADLHHTTMGYESCSFYL